MTLPDAQGPRDHPHRRSAGWLTSRGLALFASGFLLSYIGYRADAYWLQLLAFALALIAMGMLLVGMVLAYKAHWGQYWRWFIRESESNERELRERDAAHERALEARDTRNTG